MELREALRSTGSIRQFSDQVVPVEAVIDILDDARFAPSGGNRQAWHVIVVQDSNIRRQIRDLYLDAWHDYVGHVLAGLVPFSPLANSAERSTAAAQRSAAEELSKPDGFPETLDSVPVMMVICADLGLLAATDRDLGRYQLTGGASIFPFVWSILLAARDRGLGGVMTTVATRNEEAVRQCLAIPSTYAVASVVALGYPEQRHTRLKRRPVDAFTTVDTFDGEPLSA